MNKEKQIEEMAKDLGIAFQLAGTTRFGEVAEVLVNAGYRKASEDAREIFEEIEKKMNAIYKSVQYGCYGYMRYGSLGTDSPDAQRQLGKLQGVKHLGNAIAELKKKYTEDKENAD
jgi:hypothetical protein